VSLLCKFRGIKPVATSQNYISIKLKPLSKMTKFQEAIALYTSFMSEKLKRTDFDESVLTGLAEMLGVSIYDADASLVACSDKNELKRVKELFLIRDLKMADSPQLDASIKTVCGKMGTANRKKFRVVFYYLLLEEFNLLHLFTAKKATKTTTKTVAAPKTTTTKRTVTVSALSAQAAETVTLANAPKADQTLKLVITEDMAFNEKVQVYKTLIVSYLNFPDMDDELLANLTNTAGGTATVNIKSASERTNIKENFLKGRLGLTEDSELDSAIDVVNARMGSTPKYRPVFYYLLTKHMGREWVITAPNEAVLY
jgi:phage-related protein